MPALVNPRHERFCQEVNKGQSLPDAYRLAGYSGKSTAAWVLRKRPDIAARINELANSRITIERASTRRAIERLAMTKEALAREWLPVAVSTMQNYVEVQEEDGTAYFDLRKATPDQWKAIKQIQIDEYMDGRGATARPVKRMRVLLHDKINAGMSIAKLFGWIVNKTEDITRLEERLAKMTPEERAAEAQREMDAARQELLEFKQQLADGDLAESGGIGDGVVIEQGEDEK